MNRRVRWIALLVCLIPFSCAKDNSKPPVNPPEAAPIANTSLLPDAPSANTPPPVTQEAVKPAPVEETAGPQAQADIAEAGVEAGERFYDLAMARPISTSPVGLKQRKLLLMAATAEDPGEVRYLMELAEVRESAGDIKGAMDAWTAYRKLLPDDHVAQLKLIGLYLGTLQSNDAKTKYIRQLLDNPHLDVHVKAQLAVIAVPLLEQRSHDEAVAMLQEARKFYPLPEVTLLEWQMLRSDAAPLDRFKALLNILKANPTHTEALSRGANMLAEAGLSEQALEWFALLTDLHAAQATNMDRESTINYLVERYRSGETTIASEKLDEILEVLPQDPDFWFLRLTVQRSNESVTLLKKAQNAFLTRLNTVCEEVSGKPTTRPTTLPALAELTAATTQPAEADAGAAPVTTPPTTQPAVDPATIPLDDAVAAAKKDENPNNKEMLARTLADLAWFEVYFDHKPSEAARWMDAMKQLAPSDDPVVLRLNAWLELTSGSHDAARKLFVAQQSADPLSMLGLFNLEDRDSHNEAADAVAHKIVDQPHTGVLGAVLWQAVKGRSIRPANQPADTLAIGKELAAFPKDWLEFIRKPSKFYATRGEPVTLGHRLGQPFLVNIIIQNVSQGDITIGQYGMVHPLLVFDAQIRTATPRNFPAVAVQRLMGRIVLAPGEQVIQVVRLDAGELSKEMHSQPAGRLVVAGDVVTNAQVASGNVRAMAGGYARNFSKLLSRTPGPLDTEALRSKLFEKLATGSPAEKISDVELLAAYVQLFARPGSPEGDKLYAQQFTDEIDKARADPSPGIRIWASYYMANLVAGAEEEKVVEQMAASSAWQSRLLALCCARFLPEEHARSLCQRLSKDENPLVQAYAGQALAEVDLPKAPTAGPTTVPTTAPATQPTAAAEGDSK